MRRATAKYSGLAAITRTFDGKRCARGPQREPTHIVGRNSASCSAHSLTHSQNNWGSSVVPRSWYTESVRRQSASWRRPGVGPWRTGSAARPSQRPATPHGRSCSSDVQSRSFFRKKPGISNRIPAVFCGLSSRVPPFFNFKPRFGILFNFAKNM